MRLAGVKPRRKSNVQRPKPRAPAHTRVARLSADVGGGRADLPGAVGLGTNRPAAATDQCRVPPVRRLAALVDLAERRGRLSGRSSHTVHRRLRRRPSAPRRLSLARSLVHRCGRPALTARLVELAPARHVAAAPRRRPLPPPPRPAPPTLPGARSRRGGLRAREGGEARRGGGWGGGWARPARRP